MRYFFQRFVLLKTLTPFYFILAILIASQGFAQQYNFINYSIEDGLVQSQVKSMCQDQDGYVWFGTLGGLSRFDGINFENFSVDDGLLDNGIYALLTHSNGQVFIGSKGGVNVYNKSKITSFKFKDHLRESYVRAIVEDNNNDLWFGLDNGWLVKFSEGKLSYFDIKKGNIRHLFCDGNNNIWISSRRGIVIMDSQHNIKNYISDLNATQVLLYNDTVWYSTFGKGSILFL